MPTSTTRYRLDDSAGCSHDAVGRWVWDLTSDQFSGSRRYYENGGVPLDSIESVNADEIAERLKSRVLIGHDRVVRATRDFLLGRNVPPPLFRVVHPDGTEHVLIVSARKVRDERGQIVQLRGTLADITDHPNITSVAIVANDSLTAAALRAAFSSVEWGRVVAETRTANLEPAASPAQLVIAAVEPGDMETLAEWRAQSPSPGVIAVVDRRYHHLLPELMAMRVEGLLTPESLADTLPIAIMAIRSGERYIAPSFVEDALATGPYTRGRLTPGEALTEAEMKVVRMMAVGMRNAEIAGEIYVSLPTVKRCTQRIYLKLGARDRAQAIDIAHRRGLI